MKTKKAIVIGASSGIGRELAAVMSRHGYAVGIAARRVELLHELQKELPTESYVKMVDVSRPVEAMAALRELISEMDGTDAVVVSAGISMHNPPLLWQSELDTIAVNVVGFTAMVD